MITSGLVITLSSDAKLAATALDQIAARPEFTAEARQDRWLPVAMEACDDAQSRELHNWLHDLPGVEFVDVVYVNFNEDIGLGAPASLPTSFPHPETALKPGANVLSFAAVSPGGEP